MNDLSYALNTFKVLNKTLLSIVDRMLWTAEHVQEGLFSMSSSLNSQTDKTNLISLIRERRDFTETVRIVRIGDSPKSIILIPVIMISILLLYRDVPSMSAVGKGWRNVAVFQGPYRIIASDLGNFPGRVDWCWVSGTEEPRAIVHVSTLYIISAAAEFSWRSSWPNQYM